MNELKLSNLFLKEAQASKYTAEILMKDKNVENEHICYFLYKAAKGLLEAYLEQKNEYILSITDLSYLQKLCVQYEDQFKEIEEECIELTFYSYIVSKIVETKDVHLAAQSLSTIERFILPKLDICD